VIMLASPQLGALCCFTLIPARCLPPWLRAPVVLALNLLRCLSGSFYHFVLRRRTVVESGMYHIIVSVAVVFLFLVLVRLQVILFRSLQSLCVPARLSLLLSHGIFRFILSAFRFVTGFVLCSVLRRLRRT